MGLQRKLTIGASNDPLEQEADRVADQVMSVPTHSAVGSAPPRIQRYTGQMTEGMDTAPASVDHVLSSPGRPLDPSLQQDMGQRFGHDFSRVRVHTDAAAERSAGEVNANAYTVGHNIVFGTDQFTPGTYEGRRLLAHELTHVVQQNSATPTIQRDVAERESETSTSPKTHKVAFVREEGLNLREAADQKSTSLTKLKFGQRVHIVPDPSPQPGWQKVAVLRQIGYVSAARILFPPEQLIQKDPGLSLIKVKPGETFWGLVKKVYGIQGNEGDKDQNINHFINAIRAVNKPEAFNIKTDTLDDVGNFFISGRDASDTYLKENVDLWIPSFGVAAKMDVGSGTVTGEISRLVKKIEQKIKDFKTACFLTGKYIPAAIAKQVGATGVGLLEGLIEFARDAAIILATTTAVGALIGALFGGVGAVPGAEIGFEVGLFILQYYGLYMLVEAIMGIADTFLSQLGQFIRLVWTANGDEKQLEKAAQSLADALGTLCAAVLIVLAAYLLKKGSEAFSKTKFAKTVGATRLMTWLKERQQFQTSKETLEKSKAEAKAKAEAEAKAKAETEAKAKAEAEAKAKAEAEAKAKAEAEAKAKAETEAKAKRKEELSTDPQTGKKNPKSIDEAETILQAEKERYVENAKRPDLKKREPNLDFKIDGPPPYKWADVKTPINRGDLTVMATGIGEKIILQKAGASDVLHIVELKNIPRAEKSAFKANVIKATGSSNGIVFINGS